MKEIGFSIVIPVYNSESYLSKCLDSIISQPYSNIEVILVDDGSTDKSPEICDQFVKKDCRIQVVHKENGGVGKARNLGISKCTKEYLLFVDSDDYLVDKCLDIMNRDLQNYDDSYFICYNYNIISENGLEIPKCQTKLLSKYDFIEGMLYYNGTGGVWGKLFKTEIAKKISFSTTLKLGEDTKFIIDYLLSSDGRLLIKDTAVYNYVQVESSATHNRNLLIWLTKLNIDFIQAYEPLFSSTYLIVPLYDYVVGNIVVKIRRECNHFSSIERKFIRKYYYRAKYKYNIKYRLYLLCFMVSPFVSYYLGLFMRKIFSVENESSLDNKHCIS